MKRRLTAVILAFGCVAVATAAQGSSRALSPALRPAAPLQYAYNKQNPRWETGGRGPVHQFHKPYKPLRQPPGALPVRRGGRRPSLYLNGDVLVLLASLVVLGLAVEWLSWRLHLPSTLLLLLCGGIVGPATGFVDPDALLGNLLLPTVSFALALLLFHDGVSLQLKSLREIGRWISPGLLLTWLISGVAAHVALGLDASLAALLGAIVVMTGPPVIIPLLRSTAPRGQPDVLPQARASALELIGTVLVVLVFEVILTGGSRQTATPGLLGMLQTSAIAVVAGSVGALAVMPLLARRWVPDVLEIPLSLAVIVATFTVSHLLQEESGFLAVLVAGVVLATQKRVSVERLREFGTYVHVVLGPLLLVVLAARLQAADVTLMGAASLAFLAVVVLVARPAAVAVATLRAGLGVREQLRLICMAPRGVLAAAVSSVLALRLAEVGYPAAELVLVLSFLIVTLTVSVSALAMSPAGRWLTAASRRAATSSRHVVTDTSR